MNRIALLILFCFCGYLYGQESGVSFSFPKDSYQLCIDEKMLVENNSRGALNFEWDFCTETFLETPVNTSATPISNLTNGWSYKVVKQGDEWIGLLASRSTNRIFRLDFGSDPTSIPEIFDLGNPGSLLISPQGIDIIFFDNKWCVFLGKGETTTGQIVRLDFGNSLKNVPLSIGLGTFGINGRIRDLKVVRQNTSLVLLLIQDSGNTIRRVNYRESFDNVINPEHITTTGVLPNANLSLGFSITKVDGNWIIHTVSFSNNGIQQYNFGNDILGSFTFIGNYTFPSVIRPYYIKFQQEGSNHFAFVANESTRLSIINFHDLSGLDPPVELPNTSFQRMIGFDVIKFRSKNIVQGVVTGSSNFTQMIFENTTCKSNVSWSENNTPMNISWNEAGIYSVELSAQTDFFLHQAFSRQLVVNNNIAPQVTIIHDNVCVNHHVNFSSDVNSLNSYSWSFGDSQTSSEPNPTHQYSSRGDYNVSLTVTAQNGCNNYIEKTISIFDEPIADFSLPVTDPFCTNNNYRFENTSVTDPGYPVAWQWRVNGEEVSADETLQHTFTSRTEQQITLQASMPGCASEVTKTIASLEVGPVVDFSFDGHCQEQEIGFTQQIDGAVISYQWDFEDRISTEENVQYTFSSPGAHNVSLSTTNAAGCSNTATKIITIYSKPVADFSIDPPPYSCTGSPTPFTDVTPNPSDGGITAWLWNFGEEGSAANVQHPAHVYTLPGAYNVSLKVSTLFGCDDEIEKEIAITQSPPADFSHTPACVDVPVTFTDLSEDKKLVQWLIDGNSFFVANPSYTYRNAGSKPVKLTVTGNNNCISTITKSVTVPVPLRPDFSVFKNCVNQNTVFTDITPGADPVASRLWDFAELGTSTVSPAEFSFGTTGNKAVKLTVTGESGCSYSVNKNVNIVGSPKAAFTASPVSGAAPLEVQFVNQSVSSSSYSWSFADGSAASAEVSPVHIFHELGVFLVELQAFNGQGCVDKVTREIETALPLPDVQLKVITLLQDVPGSFQVIVTLHNSGNTVLKNLPLHLDISDHTSLTENIAGPVPANSMFNYVSAFRLVQSQSLKFVCASATLENDLTPENNLLCKPIENRIFLYTAYPNPAEDELKVEWIGGKDQPLKVALLDALGKKMLEQTFLSAEGFNQQIFKVTVLRSGIYLLVIHDGDRQTVQRIFVSGGN